MTNVRESFKCLIVRFSREDQGGITIMGLLLLISMLVVGGMAVDFMMFEARRATLQGVTDRSVLAAAKLGQDFETEEEAKAYASSVVLDYFEIAGQTSKLSGTPDIEVSGQSRSVTVDADLNIGTNYLRLIGIDRLETEVTSSAIEGTSDIEISLVLDTSGSMGTVDSGQTKSRMDFLEEAATDFVTTLLDEEYEDQISISLVSYSAHVNLGSDIYNAINAENPRMVDPVTGDQFVNPSLCVDVPNSEFTKTTWNNLITYNQVEHYDPYGKPFIAAPVTPICPLNAANQIIPLSQDPVKLNEAIVALQPHTTTSIHAGVKWGVTLLDPSFRPILGTISTIDDAFRGVRPTNYPAPEDALDTIKYVVLMTDGDNVRGYRLTDGAYDTVLKRTYWANSSWRYWIYHRSSSPFPNGYFETVGISGNSSNPAVTTKDTLMASVCTAAKEKGIVIYSISMREAQFDSDGDPIITRGATQMRACASSFENHFFETSASDVSAVFETIANQITDLRLNQ
jgi:Flp pilus assembly protein TadG